MSGTGNRIFRSRVEIAQEWAFSKSSQGTSKKSGRNTGTLPALHQFDGIVVCSLFMLN